MNKIDFIKLSLVPSLLAISTAFAEDSKSLDVKGGFFEKGSVSRGMFGDFEKESMPSETGQRGKNTYSIVPSLGVAATPTPTLPPEVVPQADSFSSGAPPQVNSGTTDDESTATKAQDIYGRINSVDSAQASSNTKSAIDKLKQIIKSGPTETNPSRKTKNLEGTTF